MSNLFSYGTIKNKPARSGFDLSNHLSFTAKAGELLPVYWKLLLPGTKVKLNNSNFTRTMPVNTAAYTRIREYFDWYFVPLRLINKNLPQALVQMNDQPVQAQSIVLNKTVTNSIPYTSMKSLCTIIGNYEEGTDPNDCQGFRRDALAAKLLRYLRYGNFAYSSSYSSFTNKNFNLSSKDDFSLFGSTNLSLNVLPIAAYQKIYCDWFRFEQWEKACPYTYNFDYYTGGDVLTPILDKGREFWKTDNILSLRYANYNKDFFMGVMPSAQFGSVATVSLNSTILPTVVSSQKGALQGTVATDGVTVTLKNSVSLTPAFTSGIAAFVRDNALKFDILSFRIAEATQKWKEVTQCAKQGYKEQLEAHFNVKLSEALSDHCRYIGGCSSDITISEVLNTNLSASDADIKGKGIGGGYCDETFSCNEHGILMCIYHSVPLLDYLCSGQDYQLLHTMATDLPVPEFDHIGMEALPIEVLFNEYGNIGNAVSAIDVLGYSPRYIGYKTSVDWVTGAFETTLDSWVSPLTSKIQSDKLAFTNSSSYYVGWAWFKVAPAVLDSIFVTKVDHTWDTDQFLVNVNFDVKAVQNLDYNGMPY
nr:MAG TPA: Major capsid protein [Microviridae sp.]